MEATAISTEELHNHISRLPKDCFIAVMKLTSILDVCRSTTVCTTFQSLLDSDDMWDHFLPEDLSSILSRANMDNNQLPIRKKELYFHLCHNWIDLDGGLKSFGLDPSSGAKKMMLPEKSLLIIDSRESAIRPMFWIEGMVVGKDLSRETNYAVYFIFTGTPYSGPAVNHDLHDNEHNAIDISKFRQMAHKLCKLSLRLRTSLSSGLSPPFIYKLCKKGLWQESQMREDGRWEIKLGKFSTCFREDQDCYFYCDDKTGLRKNELTVIGFEVRPED